MKNSQPSTARIAATPGRGEIWTANIGNPPKRQRVLIVSLDARNASERVNSVLVVPLGGAGYEGPTTLRLDPDETGLEEPTSLKAHFIAILAKPQLLRREGRALSSSTMKMVSQIIRRAFDPDAPYEG